MTPLDPPTAPRKLVRPSGDRMVAGVASGLGRHFDLDPALIRIAFVVLALFGGSGIALYVVLVLILPSDESPARISTDSGNGRKALLALLIVCAVVSLPFAGPGLLVAGPAVLTFAVLAAAGVLLWRAVGGRTDSSVVRASLLVLAVAGSLLLGLGAGVAAAFGGGTIVAGVVIATGLALVIGGFAGGARWLVVPALLMAVPLVVVSAADLDLTGGVGDRDYRPASMQDLRDGYRLGAGELRVDMRGVDLPSGRTDLDLEVGAGRIALTVPDDVCVQTATHVGVGHIDAFDRESDGIDVDLDRTPDATGDAPLLVVDAKAGVGEIEIDSDGFRRSPAACRA